MIGVKVTKSSWKYITVFIAIAAISALVVYILSPEIFKYRPKADEWEHPSGVIFVFRTDLESASHANVTQEDCNEIYSVFNDPAVKKVTFYANDNPTDYALHNLEITEMVYKMVTYYSLAGRDVEMESNVWSNSTAAVPTGNQTNLTVYLIGPAGAKGSGIEFDNHTLTIKGIKISEMDRSVVMSMICMFGINK